MQERMQTIGERDLEFYLACIEYEQDALRRCPPRDEPTFRARLTAARNVVRAIEAYNALTHGATQSEVDAAQERAADLAATRGTQ